MPTIILLSAIFNLILAIFVFFKAQNKTQKGFGVLILIIVAWLFLNFLYFLSPRYPFINFTYGFGTIVVAAIYFWIVVFTKSKPSKILSYAVVIVTLILSIISIIPDYLLKTNLEPILFGYNSEKGPWFNIFSIVEAAILIYASYLLIRFFKKARGLSRLQAAYVVAGFVVPIFLVVLFDFILPVFNLHWIDSFDNLTSLIFVGFISYAITRYRLFDMGIVIRKSVTQIVTFTILFVLYAYILLLVQRTSTSSISLSDNSTLLIIILIIAATIEPLRRFIYKFIDSKFESKERKQEEILKRLQFISTSNLHFLKLVERTTDELAHVFEVKPEFVLFEKGVLSSSNKSIDLPASDPITSRFQSGKIFIAEELQYAQEMGDSSVGLVFEFMRMKHLQAIVPIGRDADFVGIFLFEDNEKKIVFTSDKVEFLKKFVSQSQLAFASSLAYKYAIERIKI